MSLSVSLSVSLGPSVGLSVGLSMGLTSQLSPVGKMVIIALMFIGRLGPFTVFVALSRSERQQALEYASEEPLIG